MISRRRSPRAGRERFIRESPSLARPVSSRRSRIESTVLVSLTEALKVGTVREPALGDTQ
jgi:hypothetical protein